MMTFSKCSSGRFFVCPFVCFPVAVQQSASKTNKFKWLLQQTNQLSLNGSAASVDSVDLPVRAQDY